ncbi:hypothetical protein [Actinoplanes xinjiangensis]|jgi:hypothetical protein|uniref:Uncharacterized protein n=1 Tax=Actinoplanes xinjiangensis TaxID=512350 RepID=A0A316G2W5_9ACTN|nr:hypothetical protein [Actinoplanes xinjiangensis]PWK48727.1 hypothetical protein BC793_10571 [Actinoplanes xinjiangensis]GIF38433.1 hypothetical protein Axi01nite_27440 [Actinoplanes xinjiangensis]
MSNVANQQTRTDTPSTGWLVAELHRIREVLDVLPLPDKTSAAAHRDLGEAEIMLLDAEPDRRRLGGTLERLALVLAASGALDHAGQALSGPLGTLADWVGEPGRTVRQLLA